MECSVELDATDWEFKGFCSLRNILWKLIIITDSQNNLTWGKFECPGAFTGVVNLTVI